MNIENLKIIATLLIFITTILSGMYPFIKGVQKNTNFLIGELLTSGIFFGTGMIHMLHDASKNFYQLHYDYPLGSVIASITFLLLLSLEKIERILHKNNSNINNSFIILIVLMLSIHSFFAGTALAIGNSTSIVLVILLAILIHKWSVSFALAINLNKSNLSFINKGILFIIFSLMVPLGVVSGSIVENYFNNYILINSILTSMASGTLIYLGTLHGLEQSTLIKKCHSFHQLIYIFFGFLITAILAIWV